jgi:signal transduction histidine kinase
VKEVVSLVEGLPIHRERTIAVDVAQDATVNGSANELKQVLLNLLVNALEAVPAGSGKVSVRVDRVDGAGRVTVSDNGRGMTAEVLEKVFEPFFTEKRGSPHPGTGLGLSIAHAIVQEHRGRLTAKSAGSGKGSEFELELPVSEGG